MHSGNGVLTLFHHGSERISAGLIRPAEILVSFHIRLSIPERYPVVKDILIEGRIFPVRRSQAGQSGRVC